MSKTPWNQLEERLRAAARGLHYPRTPDVSRAVRLKLTENRLSGIRLTVRAAAILLVILAAALAVPQVRAKLIEFFQIGVIRILPAGGTEAPTPFGQTPVTATPRVDDTAGVEPGHMISMIALAGETTLEAAQAQVPFTIRLPGYPSDLGRPERVFLQEDGPMVILAWLEPADPQKVRLSLHEIGPEGVYINKYRPHVILETQVNGEYALWAQGPYLVDLITGEQVFRRLVEGNTLIWKEGDLTYRLETNLPLEEAIKIAESLK